MMLRMTPIALAVSMLVLPLGAQADEAANTPAEREASLPAVTVSAQAVDVPAPYAGGQVASGASLGLLGAQDVMDIPFNISSYTAELIANQQASNIGDVLRNDPSVRNTTSSGHAYENFRIRGFDVNANDLAINGLFGMTPIGHTPVEMFERVEVQKGPNAMFAGMAPSGAVGGAINLLPKRAGNEALTRVTVSAWSASQLGASVDAGRRFGSDQEVGVRVNASYRDGETQLEGQDKTREFLAAALDYRGAAFKASLDAYHSKESYEGGTPAMFWFDTTSIPAAPDSSINQFPSGWGKLKTDAAIARAEYAFHPKLSAFAAFGVADSDYSGFINGSHVRRIDASGNSTASVTVAQLGYEQNASAEAGLRGRFETAALVHELVLQVSRLEQETGSDSARSFISSTNIYEPTYWAMPALPSRAPKTAENTWSSVALVDAISALDDKLRLTLGLRQQTVRTTNFSAAGAVSGSYDKQALTPALAVVFKPWGTGTALYANYVEGLSKGDSVSTTSGYAEDHTFAPYKTKQKEAGLKWNAGSFAHTASLYEIAKPMLLSSGTSPSMVASEGGEKRVRGLEWNTFGEISKGWRVLGGASYSQGEQTRTQGGVNDGKDAVGVPRWQANLGGEWDAGWLAGLTLSGQLTATSSQYIDAANTQQIGGWQVLDLGVRYATRLLGRKLVARLNVDNVFDRHYYSGAFSDTTPIATLGMGRVLAASASMDF